MALRVCGLFNLGSLQRKFFGEVCCATSYQSQRYVSSDIVPPKKPLPGFIRFHVDKRKQVLLANPGINKTSEVTKILGAMWRNLPDDQKKQYKEQYEKDKEVYNKSFCDFMNNLTEEQRRTWEEEKEKKKEKRTKKKLRKIKKLAKEHNRPKRPRSTFLMYIQDHALERGDAPITEYISGMAKHWNKMPIDDKQIYYDKYAKAQLQYQNDLYDWEAKMVTEGNLKLVRKFLKPVVTRSKKKGTTKRKKTVAKKSSKGKKTTKNEKAVDINPSWMREE